MWVDDSELTQTVYENFITDNNLEDETKLSAKDKKIKAAKLKKIKEIPINLIEINKDPLWIKYIAETIALAKINGTVEDVEPIVVPIVVEPDPIEIVKKKVK